MVKSSGRSSVSGPLEYVRQRNLAKSVYGPDLVRTVLPVPPPPLRLHRAVEVLLGSEDQLIRILPVVPSPVLLSALLGPAPLLQADLSLPSLQDLLSLRLAFEHLQRASLTKSVSMETSLFWKPESKDASIVYLLSSMIHFVVIFFRKEMFRLLNIKAARISST